MKLKIQETSYTIKPKQVEGKLVVGFDVFTVKPKPRGVRIYTNEQTSVLKQDRRCGVKIQKVKSYKILKQTD